MRTRPLVGPLEERVVLVEHEVHESGRLHQVDEVLLAARVRDDAVERPGDAGIHRADGAHRPDRVGHVGVPHGHVAGESALDEFLEHEVGAVQRDLRSRVLVVVDLHGDRRMPHGGRVGGRPAQRREPDRERLAPGRPGAANGSGSASTRSGRRMPRRSRSTAVPMPRSRPAARPSTPEPVGTALPWRHASHSRSTPGRFGAPSFCADRTPSTGHSPSGTAAAIGAR